MTACPVCHSDCTGLLIDVGSRPLSVSALQPTSQKSVALPAYEIAICMCYRCTHVFNALFDTTVDQYSGDGCTMYNDGQTWQAHVSDMVQYVNSLPRSRVVEIGAGDGEFLRRIEGTKLAYEPSDDYKTLCGLGIPAIRNYFDPQIHTLEYGDLVVMRHVLEHIADPFHFLDSISTFAAINRDMVDLFIEVPCVEKALADARIEDWTYEHPNHFTEQSLRTLLDRTGFSVQNIFKTYGGEVLVAYATNRPVPSFLNETHCRFEALQKYEIPFEQPVVFWGGAGKSTMMLHHLARFFDHVVDSDERKWGKFVPGLPLRIDNPSMITSDDIVIITTNWREADIKADMHRRQINPAAVYTFKNGELNG